MVAELATAAPARPPAADRGPPRPDLTVDEVLLAFWRHAEGHYRRADGSPTSEPGVYRLAFKPLRALYGHTPARAFGPLALKAVRQRMVGQGWYRGTVNAAVRRLKHVFKWAAAEELAPVAVYQPLATVAGLQAGRSAAAELPPVGPVAPAAVVATLPFPSRHCRGWSSS